MSLQMYMLRRILLTVPLLLGLTILTFVIAQVVPVDPVLAMLGESAAADPEIVATFRRKWGFDQPLPVQYFTYVTRLLHGDLGVSVSTRRPVRDDLGRFFPATVELASTALLFSITLGLPLGIVGALKHNSWPDHVTRVVSVLGSCVPVFWLGLVLLFIFYAQLNWLPGPGRLDPRMAAPEGPTGLYTVDSLLTGNWPVFVSALRHLILPGIVLGGAWLGLTARMIRSSLLEVLHEGYITTARSKGLPERAVFCRHALPNALIPTVTVLGLTVGGLMAGAVLTETIFSWPGVGRYIVAAAQANDFSAIMGVTLIIGAIYIFVNLFVDILYHVLDPTIRKG
ncbi:MAG: ABC transporter permease [Chloroflexi bacterium]|nr:ABC transporter permease [Chloroflexota bacterium]